MNKRTISKPIITLSLLSLLASIWVGCDGCTRLAAIYAYKSQMGTLTGQTDDALHAYFGLLIYGLAAMVCRKPVYTMTPCMVVWAVELLNEFVDLMNGLPRLGSHLLLNSLSDIVCTVALPTVIMVIAKMKRFAGQTLAAPLVEGARTPGARSHTMQKTC